MDGSQLLKGAAPMLVLAALRDRESYGFEIAERIRTSLEGGASFSDGTLYPTLHRLEREGVVAGAWRQGPDGSRRRYYQLTVQGERVLASHEATWTQFAAGVKRVLRAEPVDG